MNKIKLLSYSLLLLMVGISCHAGERPTAAERGAEAKTSREWEQERRENARARAHLEAAMHKNQYQLEHIWRPWGSMPRAILAKGVVTLSDTLLCPPLRAMYGQSEGLWRWRGLPIIATLFGIYLVERADYDAYMKKRRELIDFRCKVEHLKKVLHRRKYWYGNHFAAEDRSALVTIGWFLEQGYDQAHEHCMLELINNANSI